MVNGSVITLNLLTKIIHWSYTVKVGYCFVKYTPFQPNQEVLFIAGLIGGLFLHSWPSFHMQHKHVMVDITLGTIGAITCVRSQLQSPRKFLLHGGQSKVRKGKNLGKENNFLKFPNIFRGTSPQPVV